ncbi:MAG: hypothetical protein ABF968_01625 [Acetobacter sp.]|uniref:hypothetical protein n=1 Tax=Acetobacter sp. TaxID=440 RepID=UPI0039E83EA4
MDEAALKTWVAESIRISAAHNYYPSYFIEMIKRYGERRAMARLMTSGEIQTGFSKLDKLNLAHEWSVEAGVLKFDKLFTEQEKDVARFRLAHIRDSSLQSRMR